MKASTIDKIIRYGTYAAGAYFVGITIAGAIKRKRESVEGIGSTKKYYVYAGYYENYISSKPMPAPYILRRTCRTIEIAINYADSFGDTIVYCDNVKYDLPDYIYEVLQDTNYKYFRY